MQYFGKINQAFGHHRVHTQLHTLTHENNRSLSLCMGIWLDLLAHAHEMFRGKFLKRGLVGVPKIGIV